MQMYVDRVHNRMNYLSMPDRMHTAITMYNITIFI